jgi:hypothetical protein
MTAVATPKGLVFWAARTAVAIARKPEREDGLLAALMKQCSIRMAASPLVAWMADTIGEPVEGQEKRRQVAEGLVRQMLDGIRDDPAAQVQMEETATAALIELAEEMDETKQ